MLFINCIDCSRVCGKVIYFIGVNYVEVVKGLVEGKILVSLLVGLFLLGITIFVEYFIF